MAALDTVSLMILFAALLAMAGILSSLVALRFGAPLLLIFLIIGMLAGEAGPGHVKFDDVRTAYLVGSVALALILFDGGLRTRLTTFRSVLAPSAILATIGVVLTAALTAPFAKYALSLNWTEALLTGAVVASTDAAAVFLLIHSRGLHLRPRVGATLEVESATNDPFAIFLTIALVEVLLTSDWSFAAMARSLLVEAVGGAVVGYAGGRAIVLAVNQTRLPQGLHPIFVAVAVLLIFAMSQTLHMSGFLAVYIAGLIVGNRPARAHTAVIAFLDAATWLSQIVMFVLLGLLAWPERLPQRALPALAVAFGLMFIARPLAVFLCLAPFRFANREKVFISWVGLRGAVGIFLASIPMLVNLPNAQLFFDVGLVVVIVSLLVQGWTIALAAHRLHIALPRGDPPPHRVELDLPGQLSQELVGYTLGRDNPYLRRHLMPSWAKLMLVVRKQEVLGAEEAGIIREGDHIYLLAPPERAQALDRFFVDMPAPSEPDVKLLGDFYLQADTPVGGLAEIYGATIADDEKELSVADYFARHASTTIRKGEIIPVGPIALVALNVVDGRVTLAGVRLADPDPAPLAPPRLTWFKRITRRFVGWPPRRKRS